MTLSAQQGMREHHAHSFSFLLLVYLFYGHFLDLTSSSVTLPSSVELIVSVFVLCSLFTDHQFIECLHTTEIIRGIPRCVSISKLFTAGLKI